MFPLNPNPFRSCNFRRCQIAAACGVLILSLAPAHAGLVVEWDFSDNRGVTLTESSSASDARIRGGVFYRGSGLNAVRSGSSMSSSGWGSQNSADFLAFGFEVEPGYSVSLQNLQIRTLSSLLGPGTMGLYYSGDGFGVPLYTVRQPLFGVADNDVDLSALGPLTGSVEFRWQEIGNNSVADFIPTQDFGRFTVANFQNRLPVRLNGTISSAIPEPSASALMFGLLLCRPFRRRRNKPDLPVLK